MQNESLRECLKKEISYRTSRSSGPGGQHVNKTESRVELTWELEGSSCLDENQKILLRKRLSSRISEQGVLRMVSEKYRSQYRNRNEVTERFLELIKQALVKEMKRIPTKPGRSSVEKRIRQKKIRGELKRLRRKKPDPG